MLASIILIAFQLVTTGFVPWMKYALEVLMVLIIAPIRVKKKIKLKDGKLKLEAVENQETKPEEPETEVSVSEAQPTEA